MTPTTAAGPRGHRWTKAEYRRLHEVGLFLDQRVELIDGEIIDMPPPNHPHDLATECSAEVMRGLFGSGHWVRVQMALDICIHSEPMPDVAVVTGSPRSHTATPTAALLVLEVSESSLAYDRGRKASLYASCGVADYWLIDVVSRRLEIRRRPVPDPSEDFGCRYADLTVLTETDSATPLAAPHARIAVADLLP